MSQFLKLSAFGPLDLELCLFLTDDDISQFSINLKEIKNIKDCESFLKEKKIQEQISITSKSFIVNSLLFINRAYKFKTFIELILLNEPIFSEEEDFMKEILKIITEQNFLFLLPNKVLDNLECNLSLSIKTENEDDDKRIVFGKKSGNGLVSDNKDEKKDKTEGKDEGKEERKEEGNEEGNEEGKKKEETKGDNNESKANDTLKDKTKKENNDKNNEKTKVVVQNFEGNPFFSIDYDFSSCQFVFIDLNEILLLKPYGIEIGFVHDFLQSLQHLHTQIIVNYANIIYNISLVDIKDIQVISEILTLSDIYIFEKKEALAYFNLLSQVEDDKKSEEKNLELIFLKEIKKKRNIFPKIGLFLEDFNKLTIIEQQVDTNLVLFHTDFEFELYPYQNQVNPNMNTKELKKSDEIKKTILVNYQFLKAVFFGAFLSRLVQKKSFNTSCLAGSECVKKAVEFVRSRSVFPCDPTYFTVKIKKEKLAKSMVDPVQEQNKNKEFHFQLDCTNILGSKMKGYNPLYDDNLISYFSSYPIRKQLKKVGFINKSGSILIDPDKNKLGRPKNKNLLRVFELEKVKLGMMKENNDKMKLQINNIFYRKDKSLKNVNLNELEKMGKVKNYNPTSNRKLPALDFSWEKHPLAKKCGSLLYESNVSAKKNTLKPISKDIYLNILNDFETKASKIIKTNEVLVEKSKEKSKEKDNKKELSGKVNTKDKKNESITKETYGTKGNNEDISKEIPEETIKEEKIDDDNKEGTEKRRQKNPDTKKANNNDDKKSEEVNEEVDQPNVISS